MELIEIITKISHLEYAQKKYHVDKHGEYAQLVFSNSQIEDWLVSITELMGDPLKTAGEPVTDDIIDLTEDFGEIFDHQTLFYRKIGDQRMIAMFWPWNNQESTTLKLMILNKS